MVARFAHRSEEQFARLLDSYHVEWVYEPCSFPITRSADGRVREWFTPDFYLPEFDLFVEMTVTASRFQSRKNRKIRLLAEAFPDVRVKLLTRRDLERLFGNRLAGREPSAA